MEEEQKQSSKASLHFLNGPLAEKDIPVEKLVTTIGRDRQNDIVV